MQSLTWLRREHDAIRSGLELLETFAAKLRHDESVVAADVEAVLAFLVDVGERCHCVREERHLFPLLERRGSSRDSRRITVLLVEHGAAREVLRTLTHLAASLATDADSRRAFAHTVEEAVPMLRNHLDKEERALYKLAETVLTPEDDATLAREFGLHDRGELGEAGRAPHVLALAELAARYGVEWRVS